MSLMREHERAYGILFPFLCLNDVLFIPSPSPKQGNGFRQRTPTKSVQFVSSYECLVQGLVSSFLLQVASDALVTSSDAPVTSSFLLLAVRPGAPSSFFLLVAMHLLLVMSFCSDWQANRFALDDRSLAESLGSTGPGQYEAGWTLRKSARDDGASARRLGAFSCG